MSPIKKFKAGRFAIKGSELGVIKGAKFLKQLERTRFKHDFSVTNAIIMWCEIASKICVAQQRNNWIYLKLIHQQKSDSLEKSEKQIRRCILTFHQPH